MKNTIYFLVTISLYFLATIDCKAQFDIDPVDYELFIQNEVNEGEVYTAATISNIIAVSTIFEGGTCYYFASSGTTLQEGFTVENGGSLYVTTSFLGKKSTTEPQKFSIETNRFQLYPNPTTDIVNIALTDKVWNSNVRVEVYALNTSTMLYSEQIQQKNSASIKVDLSSLPKGIYVLKAYEENGTNAITRKLIKN